MKGGSRASSLVMELSNPQLCDDVSSPVIEGPKIEADARQLGLYRTTGGGRKSKSKQNKLSKVRKSVRRKYVKRCPTCGSRKKMVGGSRASAAVMESQPKLCDSVVSPVNTQASSVDTEPVKQTYQTTGGGRKRKGFMDKGEGCSKCSGCQKGGSRKSRKSKSRKSKKNNRKSKRVNSIRSDRSKRSKKLQKGGSDWRSTLYSRGPVNQPTPPVEQLRMFTQHADFIPNEALRAGKLGP